MRPSVGLAAPAAASLVDVCPREIGNVTVRAVAGVPSIKSAEVMINSLERHKLPKKCFSTQLSS